MDWFQSFICNRSWISEISLCPQSILTRWLLEMCLFFFGTKQVHIYTKNMKVLCCIYYNRKWSKQIKTKLKYHSFLCIRLLKAFSICKIHFSVHRGLNMFSRQIHKLYVAWMGICFDIHTVWNPCLIYIRHSTDIILFRIALLDELTWLLHSVFCLK